MERWGVFELILEARYEGNPFLDVKLCASFRKGTRYAEAEGFYDGNGTFRLRYMPDEEGVWSFVTTSNQEQLNGLSGEFACTASSSAYNHGPVQIKDAVHFQYADGTRYTPIGTTCYVWHLQDEELQQRTLRTLQDSPFNKVRMCVFPKYDVCNHAEPAVYPFEGSKELGFDTSHIRPEYFSHLEKRIRDLGELGIEADLILFHPDDDERWGFDAMSMEADERYVRYMVARFGALRNVWWSLANEYDRMNHKTSENWNRLFRVIQECDYGRHLRSIHNSQGWYDFGLPWITHASIQHSDVRVASDCTRNYGKPVIIDECGYEGNLDTRWGSLTAEEMLFRMWEGICRGGYVTHGETFVNGTREEAIWWSHGGALQGKSAARIHFLRKIMEEAPANMTYASDRMDAATLEVRGEYVLQYFGPHRFAYREFALPEGTYKADLIDTWNMTVTPLEGTFEGRFRIDLPAKLYYAIRIRREAS